MNVLFVSGAEAGKLYPASSEPLEESMRTRHLPSVFLLAMLLVGSITALAGEDSQLFTLPEARVGELYRAEIASALREKGLGLQTQTTSPLIQWSLADGELPPGLSVRTDGFVVGTPTSILDHPYRFRIKVVDASANDQPLVLDFELTVRAGKLRLARLNGLKLVPISVNVPSTDNSSTGNSARSNSLPTAKDETASSSTPAEAAPQQSATELAEIKAKEQEKEITASSFSTRNTRAIFGIEQAGASSAASESHPFIDFFFSRPFTYHPRWTAWGNVRLTSTPQQIAAFVSSTSNVTGAVTADKINDLATSFDFRMGGEYRLNRDINDANQISVIAGFGATSPLTKPTDSFQIFKVPTDPTNSQYAAFFADYPEATGKTYVAFVRPERDRFLRQYFAGFRLRSYQTPKDFPTMLDITFGQNAAITGGQLKHFVLGIDGSYHVNISDRSFYIFGGTSLKFGGAKMVRTPYVLAPAPTDITLTSPNLVLTSRQMNRDVFHLGFAVDLVELFKPKPAAEASPKPTPTP